MELLCSQNHHFGFFSDINIKLLIAQSELKIIIINYV